MSEEEISPGLEKLFIQSRRSQIDLWVEHQALVHVLKKSLPFLPPEVRAEFEKYKQLKKQILEKHLLKVEKADPGFAAQLDAETPLFPSADEA